MAAYKIDGVALTPAEADFHRYLIGAALAGLAAPTDEPGKPIVKGEALALLHGIAADAIDQADFVIREMRSRLDEQAEEDAAAQAPPAGPTGHYWLGRTEEIDQWIRTRRNVRPRVVSLVESVRRRIAETRRPVSLVEIVNGWDGASMVDVKSLIGARIFVEASEEECARLNAFWPGARQEALGMLVRVMAAEGLPSDLEAQEGGDAR